MASKEYIERLQMVIQHRHNMESKWLESVPVVETFQGKTVWDVIVERFEVLNQPKAKHCYSWSDSDPKQEHITAGLELPPVKTALDAFKVYVVQQVKQARKGKT